MGLGKFNPHREYDPEKGSLSAKVTGISQQIGGASTALVGAAGMVHKGNRALASGIMAMGGLGYYAGARTYRAGKKRKPKESPTA